MDPPGGFIPNPNVMMGGIINNNNGGGSGGNESRKNQREKKILFKLSPSPTFKSYSPSDLGNREIEKSSPNFKSSPSSKKTSKFKKSSQAFK